MKIGDIVWFKDRYGNIYCSEIKEIVEIQGTIMGYRLIPIIGYIETMTIYDPCNICFAFTNDCKCICVYSSLNFEDLCDLKPET